MKFAIIILVCFLFILSSSPAQEIECRVTIEGQKLPNEARENLIDFTQVVEQYVNSYTWTKEDFGAEKIICTITISFQASSRSNHYVAQAFIGVPRPIYKTARTTALVRILDDKWEFDYFRGTVLSHNEYRFDPLLSFIDFYMYVVLGYYVDSYGATRGTPYFQKAADIVNEARGSSSAGTGWEPSSQSTYQRSQLVDELLNPQYRDFRVSFLKYHYRGLDLLDKNPIKARKNIISALEKIEKLQKKINQRNVVIKTFFDTKYMEIAESFRDDPDISVYDKFMRIDPPHQKMYEDYKKKIK